MTAIRPRAGWHWEEGRAVPSEMVTAFCVGVTFLLLATWRDIPYVLRGGLYDPDSYMRLVRIEAGLKVGHIGALVARDDSGAGLVLHWSHLLDSLLLALAAPVAPFLGWRRALFCAGAASGPISVGLLAAGATWAIAPIAACRYRWSAAIAAALSPGIADYGRLGVIHHHVLLVLVAVMVAAFAARAAAGWKGAALGAAAWFAFGLWLSPEAWPYGLLGVGTLGVAWLGGRRDAACALAIVGGVLAALLGAVLLVDPPPGALVAFDHVSLVHLAMALILLVLGLCLAGIDHVGLRARVRAIAGFLGAAGLLGAWIAIFPRVALGPEGLSTAPGLSVMFSGIAELQPLTRPAMIVAMLLGGFFGVAVSIWWAWRERSWLAAYGASCGLIVLALGFRYVRFAPYAEVMGAAALPVALGLIGRSKRRFVDLSQAFCRVGFLALVLIAPRLAPAMDHGLRVRAAEQSDGPNCHIRRLAGRFARYAGDVVLAHVDDTPELLYRTKVETVGSLYQRGVAGFLRLRAAWDSGPSTGVPAAVRASGARLILFCPTLWRFAPHGSRAGTTLAERLEVGDAPPWLRLLWRDPKSGNVLYKIEAAPTQRPAASSPSRKSRNTATRFELRSSSG